MQFRIVVLLMLDCDRYEPSKGEFCMKQAIIDTLVVLAPALERGPGVKHAKKGGNWSDSDSVSTNQKKLPPGVLLGLQLSTSYPGRTALRLHLKVELGKQIKSEPC